LELEAKMEDAMQKAKTNYFSLAKGVDGNATIRDLRSFLKWNHRSLRWLHGDWSAHGSRGKLFLKSNGGIPTDDAAQNWILRIQNGIAVLESLQRLKLYFSEFGYQEIAGLVQEPTQLQAKLRSINECLGDFDSIQQHDSRLSTLSNIEKRVLDICLNQIPSVEDWSQAVAQEFYFRWVDAIEKANPSVKGKPFETYLELRNKFETLLDQKSSLLGVALRKKLEYDSLTPVLSPEDSHSNKRAETEWNKLAHEFNKRRRLWPLRKLYEQYSFQMNRIVNCWLMSPECVSEVFPLRRDLFDLIIFDEASQLAVERSLPAVYRGKRVVVAGDEKQLRPFDLFRIKDEEEEESDLPEALATESLLILAKRIFGFRYLSWHYRSKYQELIDFSNHAFYDGQLQVAGSITRNTSSPPIRWITCKGTWNERRRNVEEALRVVEVLRELWDKGESGGKIPSVGVVTFNEPQREAILDEIDLVASRDPQFEKLLEIAQNPKSGNMDDRLFVKNIENVQGDERDIIVFSVGYAQDATGKLRLHFGSFSVEGGENRLNVAVTRARDQVVVVCSFQPSELRTDQAQSQGPKLLRKYLDYSEAISAGNDESVRSILTELDSTFVKHNTPATLIFESELEQQVYDGLTKMGYQVDTQYGYSGYRIDLAVRHPKDASRYVLAVECDGATFHSARSARERDVFRQKFLEGRGWKVERIWSRNWWRNPEEELQRIRSAIEKAAL
jgi:very-short-patch-repair endonuclease